MLPFADLDSGSADWWLIYDLLPCFVVVENVLIVPISESVRN
jgi:hypothetical protein